MRENSIKKIKRHISQFFETEYWYRFRRLPNKRYDEDVQKFVESKEKTYARDYLTCTWNGEEDILNIMLLKIEHMFWNLKNYGNQSFFYLDAYNLMKKYRKNIPQSDIEWAMAKLYKICLKEKLWIGNTYTKEYLSDDPSDLINDKEHNSDSGLCHYYLTQQSDNAVKFIIGHETDSLIPTKEIPKKKKLYELVDGDLSKWKEAAQYRSAGFVEDFSLYADKKEPIEFFESLQKEINRHKIPIKNVVDEILLGIQTFDISMTDYIELSSETQKLVRGNRRILTELLHLRRLIKRIQKIQDMDDKYSPWRDDNTWKTMTDAQKKSARNKAEELYLQDRKMAYRAVADFMAEHGMTWWD